MAVNALLYTWMSGEKLLPNTPTAVKNAVVRASEWLTQNTLTGQYKPYSAVFSGSVKSMEVSSYSIKFLHGDIYQSKETFEI